MCKLFRAVLTASSLKWWHIIERWWHIIEQAKEMEVGRQQTWSLYQWVLEGGACILQNTALNVTQTTNMKQF